MTCDRLIVFSGTLVSEILLKVALNTITYWMEVSQSLISHDDTLIFEKYYICL